MKAKFAALWVAVVVLFVLTALDSRWDSTVDARLDAVEGTIDLLVQDHCDQVHKNETAREELKWSLTTAAANDLINIMDSVFSVKAQIDSLAAEIYWLRQRVENLEQEKRVERSHYWEAWAL